MTSPRKEAEPSPEGKRLKKALIKSFGSKTPYKKILDALDINRRQLSRYLQDGISPEHRDAFEAFVNDPESGFSLLPRNNIDHYIQRKPTTKDKERVDSTVEGLLLKEALIQIYGKHAPYAALREYLSVSRQTMWLYSQQGITPDRRSDFQDFVADSETKFKLLPGTEIDNYIRPSKQRATVGNGTNASLVDVLYRIIQHPELGRTALEGMAFDIHRVDTPITFFKWGYLDGGVPPTYIEPFIEAMSVRDIHKILFGLETFPQLKQFVLEHLGRQDP